MTFDEFERQLWATASHVRFTCGQRTGEHRDGCDVVRSDDVEIALAVDVLWLAETGVERVADLCRSNGIALVESPPLSGTVATLFYASAWGSGFWNL